MRIRLNADGRVLEGTPLQIVQTMHSIAFGADKMTVAEYIDWACDNAGRMADVEIVASGDTDETKSASFVDAMVDAGLADRL